MNNTTITALKKIKPSQADEFETPEEREENIRDTIAWCQRCIEYFSGVIDMYERELNGLPEDVDGQYAEVVV